MFAQKITSLAYRLQRFVPSRFRLSFLSCINSMAGGEVELSLLKQIGPCKGVAIDVGANLGLYSLALARLYPEVWAFEPNEKITESLIAAELPGVTISHAGLSSRTGTAVFYTPIVKGVPLTGWASLDARNCPNATELIQHEIQLRTLDSFDFYNVRFIKIDVEGHEIEVLRGAAKTIERNLPHILIEIRPEHLEEARAIFAAWDYSENTLEKLTGAMGSPENYIFLPQEKRH